ncbi:MAG: UDP-N-acetylmuramoyl-L-alanine--D-glutamate ligase [Pseudomonadota bacterium]|nr:UDP-N-acetylmuramoyl-L-alanine--D-glutamate ligase [Pseudomonadota bacterium]
MIKARAFAGKHYAVYGLARSGLATVQALLASGAKVTAWDGKEEARQKLLPETGRWQREALTEGGLSVAPRPLHHPPDGPPPRSGEDLTVADLDEADLGQFATLVVTPGLPLNRHPIAERARDAQLEIIGDIELFARARPELPPHKVVGITGTNGKSTTTALIHHILKTAGVPAAMGGNIGLPILAQDPLPDGGVYVLELSSYQIDLTKSLDCDVAVLLNITPDHLDRYDSFEAYAASKARLFEMQTEGHMGLVGSTTDAAMEYSWNVRHHDRLVIEADAYLDNDGATATGLRGVHNGENVGIAHNVCFELGLANEEIWKAAATFPGLPHRMQQVRDKDGVLFVNDSKATNPTATAPALAAFDSIRWILGGQAKTDSLDECAPHFGNVRCAYTIGEAAALFERLLKPHMPVKNCGKLDAAVSAAAADAKAGDIVLLSPACASFDQYRDFEDRGDQFKGLVGAL